MNSDENKKEINSQNISDKPIPVETLNSTPVQAPSVETTVQPTVQAPSVESTVQPTVQAPNVETTVQPTVQTPNIETTVQPTVQTPNVESTVQEPVEPQGNQTEKSKKGKYIVMIIFFILLFIGVYFLPEITRFIDDLMGTSYEYIAVDEEEKLLYYNCDLEIDNDDVLYKYNYHVYQNDDTNLITSIAVTTTTQTEKQDILDTNNRLCIVYQDTVKDNYEVKCKLDEQEHTMVEYFTYMDGIKSIDKEISEMNATILEYTSETRTLQVVGELRDSGYQCREIFE